jgi:hypothetical protein
MATRIQIRRDTEENWNSVDPVLAQGELGLNLDNNKVKLGNGVDSWTELEYNPFAATLDSFTDVVIADVANGDFLRYNGSASAWINDPVNLSTDTVGDYVQSLVAGTGVILTDNSGEGATPTVAIGQAVGTSASVTFGHVSAPVTGNVTGNADTATTLKNARAIFLTGDVSGSVSFDGSSNVSMNATIQHNSVALGTDTTGNYVNDLTAGTGVTVTHTPGEGSSPTVAIGQPVGTSSSVQFAAVTAPLTGNVTGNADTATALQTARVIALSGDVSGSVSFNGTGNVDISTTIGANSVSLGADTSGDYVSSLVAGTGVSLANNSGETATPTISIGQDVATSASVAFAAVSAPLIGNVTGDVSGNSGTATALQNSRVISIGGDVTGSVSFNGTSDVNISATIQPNSVALGTDTTGNYVNDVTAGTGVSVTHTPGEGSSPTIAIGQAVGTSSSVQFAAVTAPLIGNASTATTLENARTISLSGDVSGSVSFNGSSDVSISATIQPNSVALGTDTSGDYVSSLVAGTGVALTNNSGENATPTIAIGQAVGTSASVTFGHVSAPVTGNVTGDLTGNADTATALETARTISLSGDISGSASFDGTTNINIVTDISGSVSGVDSISNLDFVQFDTTANTTPVTGLLGWDSVNGTLNLGLSANKHIHIGEESLFRVRNSTGTTIGKGAAVYASGVEPSGRIQVTPYVADGTIREVRFMGLASESIADGVNGFVQHFGHIRDLDTRGTSSTAISVGDETWAAGDILYVHPTVPGKLTNVAPRHAIVVALVIVRHQTTGWLFVRSSSGGHIDDIHDIVLTSPTDGQFLRYNSASTVWVNDTINLGTDTAGDYVQSLVAGTGVTLSNNSGEGATPTVAIGQDVSTGASVVFQQVETTGSLIVGQNIYVSGSVVTENQVSLEIDDPFIYLNTTASAAGIDTGVVASYFDVSHKHAGYFRDSTDGKFKFFDSYTPEPSSPINTSDISYSPAPVVAGYFESLIANGTAPLTVSSSTVVTNLNADKLDGQDGSYYAPIDSPTFTGTVSLPNNTVALGTQTTGNYVADVSGGTGVTITHTPGEGTTPSVAIGQDVATSASVTFAAVTAPVVGNASTASTLQTPRTISLSGDISGSVSFNGSSNVDISATIQPNSVSLGTDTTGNYVNDLTAGTGVTVTHTPGEGSSPTVAIGQAVGTSSSVQFAAVTAPLIGNVTGNADTATALATSRTIELTGDVTGSVSFNGSANASIAATIQPNSVALGTDTTGNYVADVVSGAGITISHTPGEGSSASVALNATLDNLSDVNASAPADGEFLKYVSASSAWLPAAIPTINFIDDIGDVSASAPSVGEVLKWNGSAWINDAINLGTDTTGNYVSGVIAGTGITVSHTPGEGSSASVALNATLDDLSDVTAPSPSDGQFLKYVSASSAWLPAAVPTINALDDIADVIIGASYAIGDTGPAGGKIFITPSTAGNSTGKYFEVVPVGTMVTRAIKVTDPYENITGADGTAIGTGQQNTLDLIAWGITDPETTAAAYADALTFGGFSDWFLPSSDELTELYTNRSSIGFGAFVDSIWSSSDIFVGDWYTSALSFFDGTAGGYDRDSAGNSVAPVRSFTAVSSATSGDFLKYDGAAWVNDPINLGTDTTGNYVADVVSGTGITISHTPGEGSSASVALNATLDNLSNVNAPSPTDGQFLKYVSASSAWVAANATGGATSPTTTSITVNTATTIASFDKDVANAAEFTVKVEQGSRFLSNKVLVLHNGTTADFTKYGEISIASSDPVPGTGAVTWTTQISNFGSSDIFSVAYGNNLWVAGGLAGELRTSTDAITWTTRASNFDGNYIYSVAYGNNLWVAAGMYGQLRTSTDAITWTTQAPEFGTDAIQSVAYANGLWVAGGYNGNIRTSTDAVTWTTRTSNFGAANIYSVAYGNNLWVAGGYMGELRTSTDAITWTTQTSTFPVTIYSVAYGNNLWVAGGFFGEMRTSTDAVTWTTQTSTFPGTIKSIDYGNNLWVAGGFYSGELRTSTDAITWTTRTSNFDIYSINSVAYGNNLWVAGGQFGQLRTSAVDIDISEIPLTLSADISGSDVRLRATITDAATTTATTKVLKTLVEE